MELTKTQIDILKSIKNMSRAWRKRLLEAFDTGLPVWTDMVCVSNHFTKAELELHLEK